MRNDAVLEPARGSTQCATMKPTEGVGKGCKRAKDYGDPEKEINSGRGRAGRAPVRGREPVWVRAYAWSHLGAQ